MVTSPPNTRAKATCCFCVKMSAFQPCRGAKRRVTCVHNQEVEGLRPHSCYIPTDQSELLTCSNVSRLPGNVSCLTELSCTRYENFWHLHYFFLHLKLHFLWKKKKRFNFFFLMKLLPWQHLHSSLLLWLLFTSHRRFLGICLVEL